MFNRVPSQRFALHLLSQEAKQYHRADFYFSLHKNFPEIHENLCQHTRCLSCVLRLCRTNLIYLYMPIEPVPCEKFFTKQNKINNNTNRYERQEICAREK
jgi:hypothetical protein